MSKNQPPLAETIFRALDAALANTKPLGPVKPETLLAIAAQGELATEKELAPLRTLRDQWRNAHASVNNFTAPKAKEAWLKHQDELRAKVSAGKTLDSFDGWDRTDWEGDFAAKMTASKDAAREKAVQAATAAKPIVERFISLCEKVAAEIEESECKQFAAYSVDYSPSPLVRAIRDAGRHAAHRLPESPNWSSDPARFLIFLPL